MGGKTTEEREGRIMTGRQAGRQKGPVSFKATTDLGLCCVHSSSTAQELMPLSLHFLSGNKQNILPREPRENKKILATIIRTHHHYVLGKSSQQATFSYSEFLYPCFVERTLNFSLSFIVGFVINTGFLIIESS